MTIVISANPGQTVSLAGQTLDGYGERVDGYLPQIDYVLNPAGTALAGYPANLTNDATGVWSLGVTIPSGITAVGTYIASISYPNPTSIYTSYELFLLHIHLPFSTATASPA